LLDSLRQAADAAAFACGLIVMPPFAIDVQSPSLQREKLEGIQRARAEERAAEQVEHLRRAGELLRQFQSIRESSNGIAPGQVLQQVAPADRGSTLEALLLASSTSQKQATLYAVAGPYLVRVDPSSEAPSLRLTALPPTLGPLRSVQPGVIDGKHVLLVGARAGVMVLDPTAPPESAKLFHAPESSSQLGFNSVAYDDTKRLLWATHGEQPITRWNFDDGELVPLPGAALSGGRFARILAAGTILYAHGNQLFVIRANDEMLSAVVPSVMGSPLVGITIEPQRVIAVQQDGAATVLDPSDLSVVESHRRAGGIVAASALPWMGSIRLLLARDDGPVECIGPDDQLVTQYLSPHRGYKMVAASADMVAAVSADRQRLILWRSWDGRKPIADLHVTGQARHRIADIEFA